MPFVKSKSIRATVQRSLAYILNPEKTDDLVLTSSLNCLTDPEGAYYNMKMVYERFSGKRFDEPIPKSGNGADFNPRIFALALSRSDMEQFVLKN